MMVFLLIGFSFWCPGIRPVRYLLCVCCFVPLVLMQVLLPVSVRPASAGRCLGVSGERRPAD